MSDWYQGKVNESLVHLELERRRPAACVAAAWAEYEADPSPRRNGDLYAAYRALADELEQATGFAVICGALTGRPA